MKIANPIYDVVFKYMMKDNLVARLLLSAIIGEEIVELQFQPKELPLSLHESITVLRMDFKAIIRQKNGEQKVIIIELQKAKLHTDIMRFRKYLGDQYQDINNSALIETIKTKNDNVIEKRKAFPILSIYFLGHTLEFSSDVPVIKVNRKYIDLATGIELPYKEEFIESLTHDSYVIQIPYIKGKRRNELEKLLHIFDQSLYVTEEASDKVIPHFLLINELEISEYYRPILKRLSKAYMDKTLRDQMEAEEEMLNEMQNYARVVEDLKEEVVEQNKVIEEQGKAIKESQKAIEEKEKEMKEMSSSLRKAILHLHSIDTSKEEIASILGISIDVVKVALTS